MKEAINNIYSVFYSFNLTNTISEICGLNIECDNTFDSPYSLMDFIFADKHNNIYLYHYDLEDGVEFILDYLKQQGFNICSNSNYDENEYRMNISDTNVWYSLEFKHNKHNYHIYNATNLLVSNNGLSDIIEAFDCEGKTEAQTVAVGLKALSEIVNIKRCTLSSAVFDKFLRETYTNGNDYTHLDKSSGKVVNYPQKYYKGYVNQLTLEQDNEIREAYRGGALYLNPKYAKKRIYNVRSIDRNSQYPAMLRNRILPYGKPVVFDKEHTLEYYEEKNTIWDCIIVQFSAEAKLKKGKLPILSQRLGSVGKIEMIEETNKFHTWSLTNVEFDIFLKNYKYSQLHIVKLIAFKGKEGVFNKVIDELYALKEFYTLNGNKGMRLIVKICLNALLGRFGLKRKRGHKLATYNNGKIEYEAQGIQVCDGEYLPIALFVNSYARADIIETAQLFGDKLVYIDTDSIHYIDMPLPEGIDIHPTKLGAFKEEYLATESIYLKCKTYAEVIDGKLSTKISGLDRSARVKIKSLDDFYVGKEIEYDRDIVEHGVLKVVPHTFTIGE